jgi:hypothetical protein
VEKKFKISYNQHELFCKIPCRTMDTGQAPASAIPHQTLPKQRLAFAVVTNLAFATSCQASYFTNFMLKSNLQCHRNLWLFSIRSWNAAGRYFGLVSNKDIAHATACLRCEEKRCWD